MQPLQANLCERTVARLLKGAVPLTKDEVEFARAACRLGLLPMEIAGNIMFERDLRVLLRELAKRLGGKLNRAQVLVVRNVLREKWRTAAPLSIVELALKKLSAAGPLRP